MRTGAGQASGNMTMQGLIDRDWDLIRVSAHLGARYGDGGQNPSNHFWWQGKLYSRTGRTEKYPLFEEATGYGTGEGLCGYNCRHSFGPGDPNHNPYQDFDAEENKKVYDLSQKQRRAESRIRKSKSKLIALREAMDCSENEEVKASIQEEYNKEALKLNKYNAEYDKFCEDNGLKRLQDRISVAKWNRSEAKKAITAVAKHRKSVIIETKKQEVYAKIKSGELPLKLNEGNQNKHIRTSHSYKPEDKKSYLYGNLETAQNLVNQYSGKGELKFTSKYKWTNKEFIDADKDIGVTFDLETGEEQITNRFAIHYGKNGTHVVPIKRKED